MDFSDSNLIFKKSKIAGVFSFMWEASFLLLFMYAFYYQTAIAPINGAMVILSVLSIGCMCLYIMLGRDFKISGKLTDSTNMNLIVAFVLISMLTSYFTSTRVSYSELTGQKMIEYALVGTSMYVYIVSHPGRIYNMMFYIMAPIVLLAMYVLSHGTETSSFGAIGVEELNVNVMSSLFIMAVFCLSVLIQKARFLKPVYLILVVYVFYVQINSASRRGFLIMSVYIVLIILWGYVPIFTKKITSGRAIVKIAVFALLCVGALLVGNYVMSETALGERLTMQNASGDILRKEYQEVAIDLFLENPIFGAGLNGVANKIHVYSHSMYHELLACTGVFGTLIVAYFFCRTIYDLFTKTKLSENKNGIDVYILRATLIFFVCLIVSGRAVVMIYDMYFYICIALVKAVAKISKEKNQV